MAQSDTSLQSNARFRVSLAEKQNLVYDLAIKGDLMAIMHLTLKTGAKGKAASHAQYIVREGKYASREDAVMVESGNMPTWAKENPRKFWKAADKFERANGRTYTELEISLPRELTQEQQIALVREYTKNVLGDRHAYTWAIHNPTAADGQKNPHVHLMFTERTNDGFERSEENFFKRYNPTNPEQGGAVKDRLFSHRSFVYSVREEWSVTANHFMESIGVDARIDHRSYKEQGIDLSSQNVNRVFDGVSVDSSASYLLNNSIREKQRVNGDRIIENPDIALKALTATSSTFTKRDLQRFIFNHTDGADQYLEAYNRVLGSIQIQYLNTEKDIYTTSDMRQIEREMIESVERSMKMSNTKSFNDRMNTIKTFKEMENSSLSAGRTINAEQKRAFNVLTSDAQIAILQGAAGTGKSFVLSGVKSAYERSGYHVVGAAIQGVTAQSMERDLGIESKTIASLVSRLKWEEENNVASDKRTFNAKTILLIDEAGMIGSEDMRDLLTFAEKTKTKVRMVGDKYQLNAVAAGSAFEQVSDRLDKKHCVEMNHIVRQNDDLHRSASMALSKHDINTAVGIYAELGNIEAFDTQQQARNQVALQWAESKSSKIMLAYTNEDVNQLNKIARTLMRESGYLKGDDYIVKTQKGEIPIACGDDIVFNAPNREMHVVNGSRGRVSSVISDENNRVIALNVEKDGQIVRVDTEQYKTFNHGYASTIHKAQGLTVDDAFVLANRGMNANLAYVALTRHRKNVKIVYSRDQMKNNQELIRSMSQAEEKTFSVDFNVSQELFHTQQEITQRETLSDRTFYTPPVQKAKFKREEIARQRDVQNAVRPELRRMGKTLK